MFALMLSGTAWAQLVAVSGTVTSAAGVPLPGVTVRVQGTDQRTVTDANGKYRISVPSDAVLTFAHVGDRPVQTTVSGRPTVDVTMAAIPYLERLSSPPIRSNGARISRELLPASTSTPPRSRRRRACSSRLMRRCRA